VHYKQESANDEGSSFSDEDLSMKQSSSLDNEDFDEIKDEERAL